ncbi:helix-turn-helix transcriptional regulator [Lactococcus lactis]|uniref:helix-turn-helix domain-containing protein n=1 Tax=Lactococcus lactis TaxID=1358 RepID=UPI00223BF72B|nr:helix-turn-helix transcriptional regulator [Lactococcus lactis]
MELGKVSLSYSNNSRFYMGKIIEFFKRLLKRLVEELNESHHGYLNFNFVLKVFDKEDKKKSSTRVKNSEEVEAEEKEFDVQILDFNKHVDDLVKLLEIFPNTVGEALKILMEWLKMSGKELSDESLLSKKSISEIRTGKVKKPRIETLIALCVGMNLPPLVSRRFIETAGIKLNPSDRQQLVYEIILDGCSSLSIYQCNKILRKNGFAPL